MASASQPETACLSPRRAISPPEHARRILISLSPKAGSRSRLLHVSEIKAALESQGFEVMVTTDLGDLGEMAERGHRAGIVRAVLAIGGDGTASVVRNHVPLEIPILNVPLGTENLLGRYLGQSPATPEVCRTVGEGVVISLDLAKAGNRVFLVMLSVGFDAEVIRSLHENRRGHIRRSAYFLPTLRAIRSYTYPQLRLYLDSDDATASPRLCRWLFGFNLPLYALGLSIAPDAVATDGLLDVCTFERGSIWGCARYLWHVMRSTHHTLPDTGRSRTARFRVEPTTTASVAYQLDGDYGGTLPVDVEVLAGQLRLLVSRETALRLGFSVEP